MYMCVYSFFKHICTHIYKNILTYICLWCSISTVSCKTNYIYRVTFKDGSVEYYEVKPDTTTDKTISTFIRIKPDDIAIYE